MTATWQQIADLVPTPQQRATVMIVDDEPGNLRVLAHLLHEDFDVVVATSAKQALERLASGLRPAVLLLDVMMPEMDGFELCQKVRANPDYDDIPVMFMTALTDEESETTGFRHGAVDYIYKPYRAHAVKARVKTHIALRQVSEQVSTAAADLVRQLETLQQLQADLNETQKSEEVFRQAFVNTSEAIAITDRNGVIEAVNPAFFKVTGHREDEAQGQSITRLLHQESGRLLAEAMQHGAVSQQIASRRKDGCAYLELRTVSAVKNEQQDVVRFIIASTDITHLKQAQDKINFLTWHDALTGLPNRNLLLDRLQNTLDLCQRRGKIASILVADIQNFKYINDTRGVAVADELLVLLANRIGQALTVGDTLARLGGDEFAIILAPTATNLDDASAQANQAINAIEAAVANPFTLDGDTVTVRSRMGVALFPSKNAVDAEAVLQHADTAHHQAKAQGATSLFFDDDMGRAAAALFDTEQELQQALLNHEICVYLQSQHSADGSVMAAEALARWQHPHKGLMPPALFIPLAEQTGLICEIEKQMLEQVVQMLANTDAKGRLPVSINISARHFAQPSFTDTIISILQQSKIAAELITLEITESLMIHNPQQVIATMEQLTRLGVRFSIDDFGTGYSSLSYLRQLPIAEVKIDRSFIKDVPADPMANKIVAMIHNLGEFMGLRVVAEGVESEGHANYLRQQYPTMEHQGYLYSQPMPMEQWPSFLERHHQS